MELMVIYMIACACGAFLMVFIGNNCFGIKACCCKSRDNRYVTPVIV